MSLNLDKSTWTRVAFGDVVRNVNETVRNPEAAGIDRIIAMEHMDPGELKIQRWGSIEDGTTFTRRVKPGQTLFGKRRAKAGQGIRDGADRSKGRHDRLHAGGPGRSGQRIDIQLLQNIL